MHCALVSETEELNMMSSLKSTKNNESAIAHTRLSQGSTKNVVIIKKTPKAVVRNSKETGIAASTTVIKTTLD